MPPAVKALFFDVFGTLVAWREPIARETRAILEPRGYALDWLAFADAWRGEYQGAMEEVRSGRRPFCKLDVLHRENLDRVLHNFGVGGLGENERRDLNLAWHRLGFAASLCHRYCRRPDRRAVDERLSAAHALCMDRG